MTVQVPSKLEILFLIFEINCMLHDFFKLSYIFNIFLTAKYFINISLIKAYGAARDRKFNIEGENLPGVLSARRFVGWYNGLPEDADIPVNLNVEDVAVFGQGNVALDVARMLLKPIDELKVS